MLRAISFLALATVLSCSDSTFERSSQAGTTTGVGLSDVGLANDSTTPGGGTAGTVADSGATTLVDTAQSPVNDTGNAAEDVAASGDPGTPAFMDTGTPLPEDTGNTTGNDAGQVWTDAGSTQPAQDVPSQPDPDTSVADAGPIVLPDGLKGIPVTEPKPLPSFSKVKNTANAWVVSDDLKGHWTVLWFYPFANTAG